MSARFTPWPRAGGAYGAPMGRVGVKSLCLPEGNPTPSALACAGPAGEYDAGGAYWGLGGPEGPVWAVWVRGLGREGVVYLRACSRDAALRKAFEESDACD